MSILIEGHPGIGKTTLAKEICLQWANDILLTSEKLLILLILRDPNVQKITSIEELIKYALPMPHRQSVLSFLYSTDGTGITFIIDGFDELSNELRQSSFFTELIEGDILPNARVVVTSRPSASGCLHYHVHRRIEILGFEKSSKEHYVNEALKGFPEKLLLLKQHFRQYPNIDAICYIPLNMAIIVFLCLLGSLPPTTTEMFASFILHTVCRHLKRTKKIADNKQVNKIKDLPQPVQAALQQLEKIAFDALEEDKIIFTVNDLPEMCRDDPTCYGLLQSVQCYCSDDIGTTTNSLNFLHLGMQEYFAAKYVATLSNDEVNSRMMESFFGLVPINNEISYCYKDGNETNVKHSKAIRLFNMWILFCGITKGQCISLKKYLSKISSHLPSTTSKAKHVKMTVAPAEPAILPYIEITRLLYLFQCFQEAQDDTVCDTLCKLIDDQQSSMIILANRILIPQDVTSLGFFLSRSHIQLCELSLRNCHIGDHGINILHQYLCGDKVNELRAGKIILDSNNLTGASSPLIGDLITHLQPYYLSLFNNEFTEVDYMCQKVVKTVKVLHMSRCGLTSLEASAISVMMTCLEVLDISNNNLGDDGAVILAEEIKKSSTLKVLIISSNNIGARGAEAIVNSLINTPIEILVIKYNRIGRNGATAIAKLITNHKTLHTLSLSGDDTIDDELALIIIKSMHNNNSIRLFLPESDNDKVKRKIKNVNKRAKKRGGFSWSCI